MPSCFSRCTANRVANRSVSGWTPTGLLNCGGGAGLAAFTDDGWGVSSRIT